MTNEIPRGAVYINGKQVSSATASWKDGKYQNVGVIRDPRTGAVLGAESKTGYALYANDAQIDARRSEIQARLNATGLDLTERASLQQELRSLPTGQVTYATAERPMNVAERAELGGVTKTLYQEGTSTSVEYFKGNPVVRVESAGQQAVMGLQQEQDRWSILPGVQSGVMPATPEGTGWRDTPLYWEAMNREQPRQEQVTPNYEKATGEQFQVTYSQPAEQAFTPLADSINQELKYQRFMPSYGEVYAGDFKFDWSGKDLRKLGKPEAVTARGALSEVTYNIGEFARVETAARKYEPWIQRTQTREKQEEFGAFIKEVRQESIKYGVQGANYASSMAAIEFQNGRPEQPVSFGKMSEALYSPFGTRALEGLRPTKAEASGTLGGISEWTNWYFGGGLMTGKQEPNRDSVVGLIKGQIVGGLTAVPETIYGAASQLPKYANPLNMAMLPLEAAAPVAGYFVSIAAGFGKGGIQGSSAAIMAPIAVAGVALSNPMTVGYMEGAALSTMGYMELAAVRPVEVSQGVSVRNFGILGKETTIMPSGKVAGEFLTLGNPQPLPSGVVRYDLMRNVIGKVERTGAVSGEGILGKVLFPSSEGAVTPKMFATNIGQVYKTQEGWSLSSERSVFSDTLTLGYTSKGKDLPAMAEFTGKTGPSHVYVSGEVEVIRGETDVSFVMSSTAQKTAKGINMEGFVGLAKPKDVLAPAMVETPQSAFFQEYLFAKAGTREFVDIVGAGTRANIKIASSQDSWGMFMTPKAGKPINYNLRIIALQESTESGGSALQLGETIGGKQVSITGSAPLVSAQQMATESIFKTPTITQLTTPKTGISTIAGQQAASMAMVIQTPSQTTPQRTAELPKLAMVATLAIQPKQTGTMLRMDQMTRTQQRIEPVQVTIPKMSELQATKIRTDLTSASVVDRTIATQSLTDLTIVRTITPVKTITQVSPAPIFPGGFGFSVETPTPPPPTGFGGFQLGSTDSIFEERPARKQKKRYSPDIISMTLNIKTPKGKQISDVTGGMFRPMFGNNEKKRRR